MKASSSRQPDRWQRLQTLFYGALELSPATRAAFLDEHCGNDAALRGEVEDLLRSAEAPMDFLENPISDAAKELVQEERPSGVLAPGASLTHYEIVSKLGAGGMGQVYLAQDLQLRRNVALKTLTPELTRDERALRRFEHEARAASALNHPNILTIFEFGHADGLHFIVSEFVEGPTLRQRQLDGGLELTAILDIAVQIAGALAAAHAEGIVHRDIKPDNVIVRNDGIVKVLDFGIAKLSEKRAAEALHRTGSVVTATSNPGMVLGTAKYMSPEQARGLAVDARTDIYSLGTVLYEMVSGKAAVEGETAGDLIAEILKGEPRPLSELAPGIPPELERIVSKAMRKDRETRYQSVRDLQVDLQNFREEIQFQAKLQQSSPGERAGSAGLKTPGMRPAAGRPISAGPVRTSRSVSGRMLALVLALAVTALAGAYFIHKRSNPTATVNRPRSVAILPFRNLKQDPQTDFLGFSLADAIITKLSYVSSLNVRPSSSVDRYRNETIDPQKVAADLRVDTLLTGSFIKEGDDLRITAQLIDVKPDKILWRDTIDLKYDKLLTVQDTVSQQIIKGLELNLSPAEAANLKPESAISSVAYEYYLRGVDLYALNDFPAAIRMLEQSAAIEPNYAPTWAHLGRAYTTNASLQFGGREHYRKAQAAYEKALTLNPALIEARIYMGNLLTDTGRVEQAVPWLRGALETNPNNAEAHWELGYAYRFGGMLRESVEECERARQNNPSVKINSSALNSYLYLGEYEKFLQSLPTNDSVYVLFYHGFGEFYLNHMEQASRDFNRAYELDPSLLPADIGKALSYAISRENAKGLQLLHETERKIEEQGVSDAEGIYKVAQAYAVLGDKASALRMLRRSVEGGFFSYPYFVRDPLLDSLRNESEFQSLLAQARARHDQFKARFF